MGRWQAKLEQRQAFLGRIVDIGAELFSISAAIVYAETIRKEHPERGDQAYELADLFARQARRRAEQLFEDLWANEDDENSTLAKQVLNGRYTWLEEGIVDPSGEGPIITPQAANGGADAQSSREATAEQTDGAPAVSAKVQ
jgi:hypothetical protein